MKIVHIGLPKTGTTSLQQNVYPVLSSMKGYEWYRSKSNELFSDIRDHIAKMRFGFSISKIRMDEKDFVSDEGLCGWDPYYWEEFAEKNLEAFGSDTHIILTLRKPSDFLNSVYIQTCLHEGDVQKPKDFFLTKRYYSERLEIAKFSIEDFSYSKLIYFYTSRFEKVTIVKFEELKSLQFIKNIFSLNDEDLEILKEIFVSEKKYNRAFSVRGQRIVFSLSRLLNLFGLSLRRHTSHRTLYELKKLKDRKLKISNNYRPSKFKKIVLLIIKEFNWRHFIQERVDRVFPYEKFNLNFKNLDINIDTHDEEYKKIKSSLQ